MNAASELPAGRAPKQTPDFESIFLLSRPAKTRQMQSILCVNYKYTPVSPAVIYWTLPHHLLIARGCINGSKSVWTPSFNQGWTCLAVNVAEVGWAEITSQINYSGARELTYFCLAVSQLDLELAAPSQLNYKPKMLFVTAAQSTVVLMVLSLIYRNSCYFH